MRDNTLWIGVGLGVVLLIGVALAGKKLAAAAGDVASAVNPLNPENVFAGTANAATAAATGGGS